MKKIITLLTKILPAKTVYAHCDVPCGIYDPHTAQLAAKTVLTMVQKIKALDKDDMNNFVRMVTVKEDHARICKEELLILWTDYFKEEHLEKFPDLHTTFWKVAKLCSENKQHVNAELARQLVEAVDNIADIFAQSKKT